MKYKFLLYNLRSCNPRGYLFIAAHHFSWIFGILLSRPPHHCSPQITCPGGRLTGPWLFITMSYFRDYCRRVRTSRNSSVPHLSFGLSLPPSDHFRVPRLVPYFNFI